MVQVEGCASALAPVRSRAARVAVNVRRFIGWSPCKKLFCENVLIGMTGSKLFVPVIVAFLSKLAVWFQALQELKRGRTIVSRCCSCPSQPLPAFPPGRRLRHLPCGVPCRSPSHRRRQHAATHAVSRLVDTSALCLASARQLKPSHPG